MVPHCALHCCCLNALLLQKLLGYISFCCSLDIDGVRTEKLILVMFSPNRRQGALLDFSFFFFNCHTVVIMRLSLSHCTQISSYPTPSHRKNLFSSLAFYNWISEARYWFHGKNKAALKQCLIMVVWYRSYFKTAFQSCKEYQELQQHHCFMPKTQQIARTCQATLWSEYIFF